MDNYGYFAEIYRKSVESGELTTEQAGPYIKAFETLSELTEADLYALIDTTAFNGIIKAYCNEALKRAEVNKETSAAVMTALRFIFDEQTAREVCSKEQAGTYRE